ncbi:hypothetical protein K5E40_02610 [Pseudomonas baetica]|uniref:hypothetical protein n=1 Tax=Pseudomonas baetica TaxID=674054 RepID=UPI001C8CA78B|nr:hypothetical protein [Pseudomonas baetica]MBX9404567.1 hypothetical protein [Pseudomonas baetica]
MNDFRDLKAIAEARQQHQPLRFMRSHGALYIRNDNGIVFDVHQNRSFPEFMAQNKDYADLVLAANPATVLGLIAENDRLRADLREVKDAKLGLSWAIGEIMGERDLLKVENGALRLALESCADELEGQVVQCYHGQPVEDMHPVTRRSYERDMACVTEARAAMGKAVQP